MTIKFTPYTCCDKDPHCACSDIKTNLLTKGIYPGMEIKYEGIKNDTAKLPWHLFPLKAAEEVVKVLQFGANKYTERNWEKGMLFSRLYSATLRHLVAWQEGEDNDPESNLNHLAHAACNLLFLLTYILKGLGLDDRPNTTPK